MIRRLARLLEQNVNPEGILAVTFTRTAARDLNEQIDSLCVELQVEIGASTLHSFCFSVLSRQSVFDLTHRHPRPLLSHERAALICDLAAAFGGRKSVKRLLGAYESAWARLQTDVPGGPTEHIDMAFHSAILDWLTYHRSILVGELVPLTLRFLQQNPAIQALPEFEHVLVDEYQDLNRADQALVDLLAENGSLIVIGDDSQSIYSFRHANPEGIRVFPDTHVNTIPYTIDECRRCPPNIVEMSNALISHDPFRAREIPLRPMAGRADADIYIVQHASLKEEISSCADFISDYLSNSDLPPGQVLVLTPLRLIGNQIRDALIMLGLNSLSYFSEDPLQEDDPAKGFGLLTLLVDPEDRAALRTWLGMYSSNGLAGSYRRLRGYAQANQEDPACVLRNIAAGAITVPYTRPLVDRWNLLQARLNALDGLAGLELVRALWPTDVEAVDDIRLIAENISVDFPNPSELLDELRREITQPHLPDSQSDIVRVMSLHKSKGLTASVVVIAGCMFGALPYVDSALPPAEQDAQVSEQRRLLYVAITRATETLVISSAASMPLADALRSSVDVINVRGYGESAIAMTAASPFMADLGPSAPSAITTQRWREIAAF